MGGRNNWKFSGDGKYLGLEIDEVCATEWPSIAPIVLCVIDFGGDSASQDPKTLTMKIICPVKKGSKIALWPVYIVHDIVRSYFIGESCEDEVFFVAHTISHTKENSQDFETFDILGLKKMTFESWQHKLSKDWIIVRYLFKAACWVVAKKQIFIFLQQKSKNGK